MVFCFHVSITVIFSGRQLTLPISEKIQIIQNTFLRLISHSSRYAPSAPLFKQYNLIPIDKVNAVQTCLLAHKFIYRKFDLPVTFQKIVISASDIQTYHTQNRNNNLILPRTRTSRHQFNISFRGPKL